MPNPYAARRVVRLPRPHPEPAARPGVVLAHVHKYPPEHNAGAEWYLHELLVRLVDAGHRCRVLADVRRSYTIDGVRVDPLRYVRAVYRDAEVLVTHLDVTRIVVRNAGAARLPLVHLIHNDRQLDFHRVEPAEASVILYNSAWIAETQAARYGAVPSDILRPHVPLDRYRVPAGDHDRTHVTLLNTNPAKGVHLFYELARRRPDLRFLAVRGAYGDQVPPPRDLANVDVVANTPDVRGEVYARTRLLVVPSSYESWGRVAVEAMASGIPVLAAPTPGLVEALGPAATYARVEVAAEADTWARKLGRYDDPGYYARKAAAALRRADHLEALTLGDLDRAEVWVRRLLTGPAPVPEATLA